MKSRNRFVMKAGVYLVVALLGIVESAHANPGYRRAKCQSGEQPWFRWATVTKVVDGDTVHVKPNEREAAYYSVRMLGIDTPESYFNGKNQGPWATAATENLEAILPVGSRVEMIYDREGCDKFGRVLAILELDGVDINAQQISDGYAINYCIAPNVERCLTYAEIAHDAIESGDHFLNDPEMETPYEWRKRVSNQRWDKYVADMRYSPVYDPSHIQSISIPYRLFFFSLDDVEDPYHYASGR